MVLLHGSAGSGAVWRRYVDDLQALGYRVVAPDLVGYGSSRAWPPDRRFELEAELDVVDQWLPGDGRRFHLVGYSYGGVVALGLAARRPPTLASLTLIEPVAFYVLRYAGDAVAYAEAAWLRDAFLAELDRGHAEAALRMFLGYWTGPAAWDSLPPRAREATVKCADKIRLDWEASFSTDPSIETLRSIQSSALLLHGANSPLPTRRVTATLAGILSRASLQVIDGANHLLPLTHRPAVMEALVPHMRVKT